MKKRLALGLISLLALHTLQADDNTPTPLDEIANDFTLQTTIDAEVNIQGTHNAAGNNARIGRDSFIALGHMLTDKIRLNLALKLEHLFRDNKIELKDSNFKWQEFVKEAFIEIRDVMGTPTAIIIGKQPIPFGEKETLKNMPIFDHQQLLAIEDINEVFGITVDMTEGFMGIFNRVELSAFESKAGDMEVGRLDSFSIRVSKKITENAQISISHAHLGHKNEPGIKGEDRTVIGIITRSDDGKLTGHLHGIHLVNNAQFPDAKYGITFGAQWEVLPFARVVAEYSWLSDSFSEYGVGISADLTKNLVLGVGTRYRSNENGSSEWLTGMELKVILSNDKYYLRPNSIFDQE